MVSLSNSISEIHKDSRYILEYFQSVDHNICLASIDFTRLSSRSYLMKDSLEEYPVIKKIVIENFTPDNKILLLDSQLLLSGNQLLQKFDCRKKLTQRSK